MSRALVSLFRRSEKIAATVPLSGAGGVADTSVNIPAVNQWLPVTDAERNLKTPQIEKGK